MAYFAPRFNVWCQVWRNPIPDVDPFAYEMIGYTRCQVRGTDGKINQNQGQFEILFPKYSDVRGREFNGQTPDIVVVAGWTHGFWAAIGYVSDKGAGFGNEYRQAICNWRPITIESPTGYYPVVNTAIVPEEGYLPLPTITPEINFPTEGPWE